jgi:chemosensory pili system protein ChpE
MLLALVYCAAPGPVLAETARRGLTSGFRAALAVELGSLTGDAVWVVATLAGVAALAQAAGFRLATAAIGGVFLVWLGARAVSNARAGRQPESDRSLAERAFATGATISVASPYAVPFWLGVSGSLPGYGLSSGGAAGYAVFSAAFMLTCLVFALAVAALIAWGRRFLKPRFFSVIDFVCGLAFMALGANLLVFAFMHAIG